VKCFSNARMFPRVSTLHLVWYILMKVLGYWPNYHNLLAVLVSIPRILCESADDSVLALGGTDDMVVDYQGEGLSSRATVL
jgi:hypothetical protein